MQKAVITRYEVVAPRAKLHRVLFGSLPHAPVRRPALQVSAAISSLPHPAFQVFVDPLVDAVRYAGIVWGCTSAAMRSELEPCCVCCLRSGEIATCSASSYQSLPVATAQRMLLFGSEDELLRYVRGSQVCVGVCAGLGVPLLLAV